MPPRTRKTAAPAPSLEGDAAPEVPEEVAPSAAPEAPASPVAESAPAVEPVDEPEAVPADPEAPLSPAAQAVAALLEPPAITYCWVSASGDGSAPCRLCSPAGPPADAGSFGCAHGQWVRVADEAP